MPDCRGSARTMNLIPDGAAETNQTALIQNKADLQTNTRAGCISIISLNGLQVKPVIILLKSCRNIQCCHLVLGPEVHINTTSINLGTAFMSLHTDV